jgi:SPX domain protein involved in polyphosphate accumulation
MKCKHIILKHFPTVVVSSKVLELENQNIFSSSGQNAKTVYAHMKFISTIHNNHLDLFTLQDWVGCL